MDGLILAGGQSTRMGQDKAGLRVGDSTLLQHQMARMRPVVGQLWVAGGEPGRPDGVRVLADALPDKQGPLSGILAGLQQCSADRLWVMPCDSFGFGEPLRLALFDALQKTGADIAYIVSGNELHPLLAIWRKTVSTALQDYLQGGERSVLRFYASQHVVQVNWPVLPGQFFNVNTPEDYQALLESVC